MCTHTLTTFTACRCKVKTLTSQCFNAKMGRKGGFCSYDSTQFATESGLCITCTVRREFEEKREQVRLEAAMGGLSLGGEEEEGKGRGGLW